MICAPADINFYTPANNLTTACKHSKTHTTFARLSEIPWKPAAIFRLQQTSSIRYSFHRDYYTREDYHTKLVS